MTAEEKLDLIEWCRSRHALDQLARDAQPAKLLGNQKTSTLRAIWRPLSIAQRSYSLCAELRRDGELSSITFRNLSTDESLELTEQRSASRLNGLREIARRLLN